MTTSSVVSSEVSARVLVVEDSVLVAMDLSSALTAAGYTVVGPAINLDEAMKLVNTNSLDAALLDMNLNGVMCFPVAEKLRELGVPFAFLTGYDKESSKAANFSEYPIVEKPVMEELMLDVLKTLVQPKPA